MATSKLRGHKIELTITHGQWVYSDNGEPPANNERPCGNCGRERTKDDHDGCLGTISNVMNACCGHGTDSEAYVQFWDLSNLRGSEAVEWLQSHRNINI